MNKKLFMINIKGQTNVNSLRIGKGAIKGIGKEAGRFVVATMDIPWDVTRKRLGAQPLQVIMIESMEEEYLESLSNKIPPCNSIIGIGGGQAIDAGKYFAWKKNLPLISIPTILSVDAFVTPAAGIRRNHEVVYVGEVSPDPLIIDYDVVRTAPPHLNVAGIGDLLSMHTASFDWEHAERQGQSEFPFKPEYVNRARQILEELYGILPEIRDLTDTGLRAIVEGYMKLNTICLPAGHYRVEEGSEHYLFYELEERLKRPFIHGHIVGLGIYLMSRLQENRPEEITRIMDDVGLKYHPVDMNISREDLKASLLNLRSYVESRPKLWYTVINDSNISAEWAEQAMSQLHFE